MLRLPKRELHKGAHIPDPQTSPHVDREQQALADLV